MDGRFSQLQWFVIIVVGGFLALVLIAWAVQSIAGDEYVPANGNLWSGVKLYYGESRAYAFEVLGGNDKLLTDAQVLVRYPSGNEEWKTRDHLTGGLYWVRGDDPALDSEDWHAYSQ